MVENNIVMSKAISKSELAEKYGIHISTLRRWIHDNKDLLEELQKIGFNKNRNMINPRELSIITKHLGY